MAERNPKPEYDKTKTFINQNNLQETLSLSDKELEKFVTKVSKLEGMTEQKMISFLIKSYTKGAIKIKVKSNPSYYIDNGTNNTTADDDTEDEE